MRPNRSETADRTEHPPWDGFRPGSVAEGDQRPRLHPAELRRPTTATSRSWRRRRRARKKIWDKLTDAVRRGAQEGRARRLADSRARSPRTRRATSTATTRSSSACRPTRRSSARSCRTAACAWCVNALKAYGYEPDPHVVEAFTKYRKTHNEGVFDAYTADIRRCRSSHILTGLPDAYGRGRIIGDYRRVALYGVNAADRAQAGRRSARSTRACRPTTSSATARSSSEQIRALKELQQMAASYGFDISGPARNAKRSGAVALLRLPRRREGTERRGDVARAATRRSSTSTSSAIWRPGTLTEEQAQEIIDDFVIKLRIVRFLRTPEYDELFAGDPTWVTESIGGMGDDGRRWSRRRASGSCRRSTTSAPRPNRT